MRVAAQEKQESINGPVVRVDDAHVGLPPPFLKGLENPSFRSLPHASSPGAGIIGPKIAPILAHRRRIEQPVGAFEGKSSDCGKSYKTPEEDGSCVPPHSDDVNCVQTGDS